MVEDGIKRKLAAIMSADAAGYTRLMRDDELATFNTLSRYRQIMSDLVRQHKGRVVDSVGDNLLAEFSSVVDAVQSATAIQKELAALNAELPDHRRMQFRVGINVGDIILDGGRLYGDGINIAARLEKLAEPGGICISRTAYDQIESKLPFGYEYLGRQQVKNIDKPLHAYRVVLEPGEQPRDLGDSPEPDGESDHRSGRSGRTHGRGESDSFTRIRSQVHEFARDVSQDEHLRGAFRETREKVRTLAEEASANPAGRGRLIRTLIHSSHFKTFIGLSLALGLINALTSWGQWWFQYPTAAYGLAVYIHWLNNTFFSDDRIKRMRDRLYLAELQDQPDDLGPAGEAALDDRVAELIRYYRHLYLYVGVIALLAVVNLTTNPFYWWFLFPALMWGAGLFLNWTKVKKRSESSQTGRRRSH